MSKRDEQRRQADLDFEEIRQSVAAQSDEWLCEALREIPHRKWIAFEKDLYTAVGVLAHHAAKRIADLTNEVDILNDALEHNLERTEKMEKALRYYRDECTGHEPSQSVLDRMVDELIGPPPGL